MLFFTPFMYATNSIFVFQSSSLNKIHITYDSDYAGILHNNFITKWWVYKVYLGDSPLYVCVTYSL